MLSPGGLTYLQGQQIGADPLQVLEFAHLEEPSPSVVSAALLSVSRIAIASRSLPLTELPQAIPPYAKKYRKTRWRGFMNCLVNQLLLLCDGVLRKP